MIKVSILYHDYIFVFSYFREMYYGSEVRFVCTSINVYKIAKNYWYWFDLIVVSLVPSSYILFADVLIVQRVIQAYFMRKFMRNVSGLDIIASRIRNSVVESVIL